MGNSSQGDNTMEKTVGQQVVRTWMQQCGLRTGGHNCSQPKDTGNSDPQGHLENPTGGVPVEANHTSLRSLVPPEEEIC